LKEGSDRESWEKKAPLVVVCPDLAAMMGFCHDCYRDNVRIVWPYLTCYCRCNGVGVFALLTKGGAEDRPEVRIGSWKMKMENTREEFERQLPGLSGEPAPEIHIRFT